MTKAADLSALGSNVTTAGNLSSASTLSLQTNSTTAITVDSSQNVGIGTASPAYNLQVSSASDSIILATGGTTSAGYVAANGGARSGLTGALKMFSYSSGVAEITNASNAAMTFGTK